MAAAGRPRGLRRAMPESIAAAVPAVAATRKRRAPVQAAAADDNDEDEDKDEEDEEEKAATARKSRKRASSSTASSASTSSSSTSSTSAESTAAPVLTVGYTGRRALPTAAVTFLRQLAEHNDRDWFKAHQGAFEAARDAFLELLQGVAVHLQRLDSEIGPQDPRQCMFRIFRDVRFTTDKTPYKTCLSGALARGGRKSPHACYYLHLQPGGESFVGGGMYMPSNDMLRLLREAIAQGAGAELRAVLDAPAFKRRFGPDGIFGAHADRLKTAPKGFAKDHPYIDLLQLKSFVTGRKIPDSLLTSPALLETIVESFAAMVPLVHLLNSLTGLT